MALTITVIVIVLLLVVSTLVMVVVKREIREVVGAEQLSLVTRVAREIDKHIAVTQGALIAGAAGIAPSLVDHPQEVQHYLENRVALRSLFDELLVYDARLKVLAEVPAAHRIGESESELPYLTATLQSGSPQISPPQTGSAAGRPVIVFTAPIRGAGGNVVGMLNGTLELLGHNFLGDLALAHVGKTGMFALLGLDRTILVSRETERIQTQGPPLGVSPYFDRATAGMDGWEEAANSRALHAVFAYARLQSAPWSLVAALPVDEAFAPVAAAQFRVMELAVVVAIILLPLLWFACFRMLAPLDVLRDTIRRIRTEPDAPHFTGIESPDEIGALAGEFDAMVKERYEVDRAMRQSDARFRSLVDSVKDYAICLLDASGHVASWNEGAERIERYSAEQVLGRHFSCFYPREAVEADVPDQLLREAEQTARSEDESWRIRRDGSRFWANTVISRLSDADGRIAGFVKITRDLTDRYQAREAVAEREARLQAFMSHSPNLMFMKDMQGRYVLANEKFLRSFAVSAQAVIGHGDEEFLQPQVAAAFKANDRKVLETEAVQEVEEGAWYADGWHTSIVSKFPIRDSTGKLTGLGGIVTDVTERRHTERALQASERRLRLIIDNMPAMVLYVDREERYRFVNPTCESWFGLPPAAYIGRTVREMRGESVYRLVEAHLRRALAGERVAFDYESVDAGARRHLDVRCIPDINEQGRCEGIYVLIHDITQLKQADRILREAQTRFRAIGDASPVGIFVVDADGRDSYVNRRYRQITGLTSRGTRDRGWRELVHPDDREQVLRDWDEAVAAGRRFEADYRYVREDGSCVWAHVKANPFWEDAEVLGYVGTVEDITRRKEAEHRLSHLAHTDQLTGLPNRSLFNDRLRTALARRARGTHQVALMYLDIDRFKSINDTYGHGTGDEVLRAFGHRLTGMVRAADTVARLGGDEFVIILEEIKDSRDACRVADKIIEGMTAPIIVEGQPLAVTASIGVACSAAADARTLLEQADGALYAAKRAGKNRYELAAAGDRIASGSAAS